MAKKISEPKIDLFYIESDINTGFFLQEHPATKFDPSKTGAVILNEYNAKLHIHKLKLKHVKLTAAEEVLTA